MVEGAMHLSSFLSWGGDLQHVLELLRTGRLSPSQIKFFSGYSGWGLSQLESEVQAKAWFIADLRPDYIFSKDEELLWKRVMTDMGDDYAMLTNAPTDPRWN
jgi:putative transcriptional regulator